MFNRFVKHAIVLFAAGASTVALAQGAGVDAEVRKIDKAQQKITLKHGEIKSLDMPAMTMVFRVKDAKMLEALAEGDKVKFTAEKVNGQFTITSIGK